MASFLVHEIVALSICQFLAVGDVRLVGGTNQSAQQSEGFLEIFHDQTWGRVCEVGFTDMEAQVVC